MRKIIIRFLTSLFLGSLLALFIVQKNEHIQNLCKEKIISLLEKEWHANVHIKHCYFNFFTQTITLENGAINPKNKPCAWSFKQGKIYIPLLSILLKNKIQLHINFYNVAAETTIKNKNIAIVNHLIDIFDTNTDDFEIKPHLIGIHNLHLDATIDQKKLSLYIQGLFEIKKTKMLRNPSFWHGELTFHKGNIFLNEKLIVSNLYGTNTFSKKKEDNEWLSTIKNSLTYKGQKIFVNGTHDTSGSMLHITNKKRSLNVTCSQKNSIYEATGSIPLNLLSALYEYIAQSSTRYSNDIRGTGDIQFISHIKNGFLETNGIVIINNASYKNIAIKQVMLRNLKITPEKITSSVMVNYKNNALLNGSLVWSQQQGEAKLSLKNMQDVNMTQLFSDKDIHQRVEDWLIPADHLLFTLNHQQKLVTGSFDVTCVQKASDEFIPIKSSFSYEDNKLYVQGKTKQGTFKGNLAFTPHLHMEHLSFVENKRKQFSFSTKPNTTLLNGFIHFPFLESLFSNKMKRTILGSKAKLLFEIDQSSFETMTGHIKLQGGQLYIPETRNLIQKISLPFTIDTKNRKIDIENFHLGCSKGSIKSPKITCTLSPALTITQLHVPLEINNLFINWKKDFYGFMYGTAVIQKSPKKHFNLQGNLVLKKSLLKNNVFSEDVTGGLYSTFSFLNYFDRPFDMGVIIKSEEPLLIKTTSLDTQAHFDIAMNFVHNDEIPKIHGAISLHDGFLQFLNNKLYIEYGKVQFMTSQMNDPLINLVAKNKIKKYWVTLQVTGSLQKPTVLLESYPALREEQILSLLLAGSENASLQADFPAMLMQNLHTMLLGNKKIIPKATAFFDKLTRSLKYVQITPNFTDQSGRGGIKGIVSIDLNDQLHAQIQKNFNMQEDFAFQIEYLLSDDINIKIIKDQREELGSEVEVRFKL